MSLELRVQALGVLLAQVTGPVAQMSPHRRAALREQRAPRLLTNLLNGKRALGVTSADVAVSGVAGSVPARVYRPWTAAGASRFPVVVVFHGGGFMFGNLDSADWLCSRLAAQLPAVVVSGTYRLAPEHPAPAALEDAFTVARWAAQQAEELGGDRTPIAVLGESSGGTLAASVALRARDTEAFPVAVQALVYPITDLSLSSPSLAELPDQPILRSADVRSYVAAFLGGRSPTDPVLSPLHATDHRGLPPAVILGAGHDPLRDDSRRYAARLRSCGVPVEHYEFADAPHGFFSFPNICRTARPALDVLVAELRSALRSDRARGPDGRRPPG